jgi:biotin operon repressor
MIPAEAPGFNSRAPARCLRCSRPLVPDEIAMTKKMINRGAESFFCLSCLADHFEVSEEALRKKIKEFREMGCTLFSL